MGGALDEGADRRQFLKRMVVLGGAAFAVPAIASFALEAPASAVMGGSNTCGGVNLGSNICVSQPRPRTPFGTGPFNDGPN